MSFLEELISNELTHRRRSENVLDLYKHKPTTRPRQTAPLLVTSSPISTTMAAAAAATTAAADAARDGQTALDLRLAKHLTPPPPAATNNHNHNVAFSPVSVHAALALTAAGAHGATLAQLLAFLGAPSAEELADFGRRVADRVLADRSGAGGPRVLFGGGV